MAVAQEKSLELIDSILEIAAKQFAEKGFSGARVDEIAHEAGVNKATMYYHIGNKQALYEQIFIEPLEATLADVRDKVAQTDGAEARLRVYIKCLAQNMTSRYAYFPAVMMREVVSGAARIPERAMRTMCDVQLILREIISDGVEGGSFRTVNPFMVHMLIMGSLSIYTTGGPMRQRMTALFDDYQVQNSQQENQFMLDEIVNMIVYSVLNGGVKK